MERAGYVHWAFFHISTKPHMCVKQLLHRPLKLGSTWLSAGVIAQFGATQQLLYCCLVIMYISKRCGTVNRWRMWLIKYTSKVQRTNNFSLVVNSGFSVWPQILPWEPAHVSRGAGWCWSAHVVLGTMPARPSLIYNRLHLLNSCCMLTVSVYYLLPLS